MPKIRYSGFKEKLRRTSAFSFRLLESRMGKNYAKVFVHNLKKNGEIITLIKGWYSFKKSPYMITIPLAEAYIGLGTAAFIHNAWGQVPNIDVLTPRTPRKIKVGERIIGGRKVLVRKISRKLYFGYEARYLEEAGDMIRVSDPEKTLIDMIYFNYPFLDEITPGLLEAIDKKKLVDYLKRTREIRGGKRIEKEIKKLGILS